MPPRGREGVCRTCRNGPTPTRTFVADLIVRSNEPRVPEDTQTLIEHCDGRHAEEGIRWHGSSCGFDLPKERAAAVALVQCLHAKGGHVGAPRAQTGGRRNKRRVEASKRPDLSGRAQYERAADVSKVNADRRDGSRENDWAGSPKESSAVGSKGCLRAVHLRRVIDSVPRGRVAAGRGRCAAHSAAPRRRRARAIPVAKLSAALATGVASQKNRAHRARHAACPRPTDSPLRRSLSRNPCARAQRGAAAGGTPPPSPLLRRSRRDAARQGRRAPGVPRLLAARRGASRLGSVLQHGPVHRAVLPGRRARRAWHAYWPTAER
eukprot:scaffold40434_cov69-Phaeocystis_antarctica.AAC.1